MAAESSFDVVSQVDMNEVRNAVQMTQKELASRFDFKGTVSTVSLDEHSLVIVSENEGKLKSVIDVLEAKLVRRKVPLKALQYEKAESALGGTVRQTVTLAAGIPEEKAKAMNKLIRKEFKRVRVVIQGDSLRVYAKSRDDLQAVMSLLRDQDFGQPLQFVNYR